MPRPFPRHPLPLTEFLLVAWLLAVVIALHYPALRRVAKPTDGGIYPASKTNRVASPLT